VSTISTLRFRHIDRLGLRRLENPIQIKRDNHQAQSSSERKVSASNGGRSGTETPTVNGETAKGRLADNEREKHCEEKNPPAGHPGVPSNDQKSPEKEFKKRKNDHDQVDRFQREYPESVNAVGKLLRIQDLRPARVTEQCPCTLASRASLFASAISFRNS